MISVSVEGFRMVNGETPPALRKTCPRSGVVFEGISFCYPDAERQALQDISLEVPTGQLVMIMGASGAGKSTLANTLNGLIPRFIRGELHGTVRVAEVVPQLRGISGMAGIVGLVFQDFETQLFSTRVDLEIAFCMENRGIQRCAMQEEVRRLIGLVGLDGFEQYEPSALSGGQKQRLAIGAVLAGFPKVLCLDEPTTDLDPVGKREIFSLLRLLRTMNPEGPNAAAETIMIVEHETEEAVFVDRIVIMNQGRIVADGTPEKILPQVSLFEQTGLMPLSLCEYFHQLGFPNEVLPLTLDEAEHFFHHSGLTLDGTRLQEIGVQEEKRRCSYGSEIIRVDGLVQAFGENVILQGVDLCIREKEFVAVLGANGSGKTTLVKHLNGLLRPKQGAVYLSGSNVSNLPIFEIGKTVGYVFQNPDQQIFCDTVFEEVSYGLRLRGISEKETAMRVREALDAVGLNGCEKEDPFSLSKGQRQRVAVASVLAIKPRVLVLDEPTTGLDYKDQKRMMELVKNLNEAGHTIVMITHTMWVVAEYAHRVVLVRDGRIAADGGVREIFADEAALALAEVCPPQITRLGNRLGGTVLSVKELLHCTQRPGQMS